MLSVHTSPHVAGVAKKHLRTALTLVAEDFQVKVPTMPSRTGRGRPRRIKKILTPDQVGFLLEEAERDTRKGMYYAFPFLTGVRPSEQLALQWRDVDSSSGLIHVRRMVEQGGRLCEFTKTAAGMREIPLAPALFPTTTLFDTERFTRDLEAAYEIMWRRPRRNLVAD